MTPSPPRPPAIVLARGLGTRMRAAAQAPTLDAAQTMAADAGLKTMIPFGLPAVARGAKAGRPFLDHVLHALAEAGIQRVGLVLGPEHAQVREYYRALDTRRLTIDFITQLEPLGTADAVASAEAWTDGQPFLALNGDNVYPVDVLARLASAVGPAVPGFEAASLGLPPARLGAFGLILTNPDGRLARVVEKPGEAAMAAAGSTALVSMNLWRFDARVFEACRTVPRSARGERELPQAVSLAASRGVCFEVIPARGPVLDLSRRSDIPLVARALDGARVDL